MSSFKSYGKVNELDQMMLEAKRKTRKRITIIGLSSIIFIGVVIGAVFGVVNNNSKNDHDNNASQNSVTNSMKAVCDVTLYKDSCYESLHSVVNSGKDVQPEELFKLSINVALTHVSKIIEYFNDHGVFKNLIGNDSRNKEALKNCRDLLDLAVDHLNNSLTTSGENSSLFQVFDDLQTWLSAAGTILSH
jgi:pectinesterase